MRWILLLAAGLCPLAATAQAPASPAGPEDSATAYFSAGADAFARGDYAAARAAFQAAIASGSDGPSAHYNLAVSEYRLGNYAAAESGFRTLGRRFPDMRPLATYNLGLSLVRQDRQADAREAFLAAAQAEDETVSSLAFAMLARLPGPPADTVPWTRLLDFGVGHDDNVQLIDPIALPEGAAPESAFAEFAAFAGGPVGSREAWSVAGSAYLIAFSEASDYDQHVLQAGASRAAQIADWTLAFRPRLALSYIGGDGFERSIGAALGLDRRLGAGGSSIAIEIGYDDTSELDSRFAYVDGDRFELALRHDRRLQASTLSLEYRFSDDDRAGAGLSAERDRYLLIWRRRLTLAWDADFLFEYRHARYGQLQPVREEDRTQAGIRAVRTIGADWQLGLSYRYWDNDSTDPVYGYRRNRVSIGASRQF